MAIPIRRDHYRPAPTSEPVLRSVAPTPQLTLSEIAMTALRIIAGLMFMQHGLQKLFGFNVDPTGPQMATPQILSQLWFAGVIETCGGALIALGLFTRVVAFLVAGEMAVAYFQVHLPRSFWPILNQGELAALYCWLFLTYAASGAGRFSLDHLWRRTAST